MAQIKNVFKECCNEYLNFDSCDLPGETIFFFRKHGWADEDEEYLEQDEVLTIWFNEK